jgi:hypothetical protein
MLIFAVVTVQRRRQRAGAATDDELRRSGRRFESRQFSIVCRGGQSEISHQPQKELIVDRMEKVIDPRNCVPCYRSSLFVCEHLHNKPFPE